MPHLPYVERSALEPETRDALDALPDLNLFRMLAHAETAFVAWLRYSGTLLTRLALDPVRRELAILRVARTMGSEYEWVQHVDIAERLGATQEQVAAIEAGDVESPVFDEGQRAVLRITTDVIERRTPALGAMPPREVVELLLVVGQYMAVALIADATGIETDAPAGLGR
jgi:4-carboxymuconolactone decarboxylase